MQEPSRGLGDHEMKANSAKAASQQAVVATLEFTDPVEVGDVAFCLTASDGLFDVLTPETVVNEVGKKYILPINIR